MSRTLNWIWTLWGAEWCQVGLDHSTAACPTLLAPPPLPSPNPTSTTTTSPCSGGVTPPVTLQWHQHWLSLGEWREKQREREWWGALHMEGFGITVHILWVHSVIMADFCGCLMLMGACFNWKKKSTQIKKYFVLHVLNCIYFSLLRRQLSNCSNSSKEKQMTHSHEEQTDKVMKNHNDSIKHMWDMTKNIPLESGRIKVNVFILHQQHEKYFLSLFMKRIKPLGSADTLG